MTWAICIAVSSWAVAICVAVAICACVAVASWAMAISGVGDSTAIQCKSTPFGSSFVVVLVAVAEAVEAELEAVMLDAAKVAIVI